MSFEDKIARAQAAQEARPRYKEVPVSLESELSEERDRLMQQIGELTAEREQIIAAAAGVLTLAPDTRTVDRKLNQVAKKIQHIDELDRDNLITVRVYKLGGDAWLDLVAGHPPRGNSAIDLGSGYNVNTGTLAALITHGRVVDDGEERQLTDAQWAALIELIGGQFMALADAVYEVNVRDAQKRTAALKNSFEAALASAKK